MRSGRMEQQTTDHAQNVHRRQGEILALRYLTPDGRIEMCWPCRVVSDDEHLLALFIAAGSKYKASPKRSALEKLSTSRNALPPDEYVWRKDTLRLMLPGRQHSVWLFWENDGPSRRFLRYFVNLEEPFRRTAIGVDTQDHTLDVEIGPTLNWRWRDVKELAEHVRHGFYTAGLAGEVWDEARRAVDEIMSGTHPCLNGWISWSPDPHWVVPQIPAEWSSVPVALWDRHYWAYGHQILQERMPL